MKKVVYQDNFAFLYLTKSFYDEHKILSTVNSYSEFVNCNVGNMGNYFVLKFELKNFDYTLKEIVEEFSNYLLSEEYQVSEVEVGSN